MLKKILLILGLVLAAFLVFVAFQPDDFRVERRATIAAPAASVFARVNDFQQWDAWSPWAHLDPAMKKTVSTPSAGTNATYAWAGNSDVGEGRMTITESRPSERIQIRLEFIKPFAATNDTLFTFEPSGAQTTVTWAMSGRHNFASKAMCVFMNMDKMVGGDFEKGLAQLKTLAETPGASR